MPRRALNAGSTLPPLAVRTARTTAASMVGKASLNVFSACSRGLNDRGGFDGGAASSLGGGLGTVSVLDAFVGVDTTPVSWSLSKSNGRAVVGDSGGPSEGFNGETGDDCAAELVSDLYHELKQTYSAIVSHDQVSSC